MQGETAEDLSKLTLKELLDLDLELEELLDIREVLTKIRTNMKVWVDHLRKNPNVAHKLIAMGLKCPMHLSNNLQMKNRTHIAAEVLTCDHQALADFFIQPTCRTDEDEIEEEIETEESQGVGLAPEAEQYVFLTTILDYTREEEPDQNCLNYMAKALQTLVRKKISRFLEFFLLKPEYFTRLAELSHFPSISHLLAKMLTDDEDHLTEKALSVKKMIVPALLHKLHQDIHEARSLQLLEGLEDILNSSRYSDNEQPTELQKASKALVSSTEITFMMNIIFQGLQAENKNQQHLASVTNASTYIGICLSRMAMDELQELLFGSTGPQEFKPTLEYQLEELFLGFCKWASVLHRLWEFKNIAGRSFPLLSVKVIEPLILITKHSLFAPLYSKIPLEERSSALQALLKLTCATDISGILLQGATSLVEKMLVQEQSLAESGADVVPPSELYFAIENYSGAISVSIALVLEQTKNQRNRNQKGIYFRKNLLLLDNYFEHPKVLSKYPHTPKLEKLFPQFNHRNCQLYAEKAVVLDHPGGAKAQPVDEFKFIAKNLHLIRSNSPESEGREKDEKEIIEKKEKRQREEEKPKEILSKIDSIMKARKDRVKQQNTDKDSAIPKVQGQPSKQTPKREDKNTQMPENNSQSAEGTGKVEISRVQSPVKGKEQAGLNFFVRHLMIY